MEHKKNTRFIKKVLLIFGACAIFSVLACCAGKDKEEGKISGETKTVFGGEKISEMQRAETTEDVSEEMAGTAEESAEVSEDMEASEETKAKISAIAGLPERRFEPEVSLESDSEEARLYESFLRGECSAEVSEHYHDAVSHSEMVPFGNNRKAFYLRDVLDFIILNAKNRWGHHLKGVGQVKYGLIDCGGDGSMELAVEIAGVHIYSEMDDSSVLMVFKCKDGKVEFMTYEQI